MTLSIRDLAVSFGALAALRPCRLDFAVGAVTGLLGPNGAGKTSLLRAIAGLVASHGSVRWLDSDLAALDRQARARTIAYLPQATTSAWPLTVAELVMLGRLPHRRFGERPDSGDRKAVDAALLAANVEKLASRPINSLSGGEQTRAHLARVLAVESPVLLVDEPVANLDPSHQLMIMNVLRERARARRCVIAVMHDLTLAARYCDRVILLNGGRVAADGRPQDVLTARAMSRVYGVRALVGEHEGEPLVVPWQRSDGDTGEPGFL